MRENDEVLQRTGTMSTNLLLLILRILRDEHGKVLVDTPLLHPLLNFLLDGNIEGIELRANVQAPAFPVSLGSQLSAKLCVGVVGHVINDERALLTHSVNVHGPFGVSLHSRSKSQQK